MREAHERIDSAAIHARRQRLLSFLENRAWAQMTEDASQPWSKEQEARALGYGDDGEPACFQVGLQPLR